ncbi:hypothetical protein SNN68_003886 [Cronobacter sakazakii]|uniref:hypothetical protein n=1 Tax=Cronobacter sakazakii TaxID=28141 RepID=UPI000BE8E66E|nr:hypothetical protein [Cronobacter sakazakii]EGT4354728.1 hypothetical protein [Cronobacter sakazakii]ELY2684514.1 hypothetical protein [Cronobacter sakazakii]ELY5911707.1 hypothetical protein [Cronobacter sakazakii]ELY6403376.1 hypothetical protein [Cronobacter sakazakii]MDK1356906.1 hypothetical protein [Cronobacter sakazakii]
MSWHHGDYIDLISAVGTAIAAGAAAYAAVQSRKSAKDSFIQQQKSFKFERERHLHDLLRAEAMKANESVKNTKGQDWTFFQAANATYAIDAAKQIINSFHPKPSSEDIERYKLLFLDQLNYEITSEMNQAHNMPDGFWHSHKGFRESSEIIRLWLDNLRFFNFLKDEVE